MLSYENPAGDFQGITYETPRSGKPFKKPPEKTIRPAASKATWYREKPGLLAQVQPGDQGTIALNICLLQVLEHVAAPTNHQQQTAV